MSTKRVFSAQFKSEAVQLVVQTKRPIAHVARELGINESTLGEWVTKWRLQNLEPRKTSTSQERASVLEKENRRLRLENEFLKKAAAFFAKTHP